MSHDIVLDLVTELYKYPLNDATGRDTRDVGSSAIPKAMTMSMYAGYAFGLCLRTQNKNSGDPDGLSYIYFST